MNFRIGAALLLGYALSVSAALAQQGQGAAAVSATSGTVVVQKAEGSIRTLAPGSMVQAGDVITTQPDQVTQDAQQAAITDVKEADKDALPMCR